MPDCISPILSHSEYLSICLYLSFSMAKMFNISFGGLFFLIFCFNWYILLNFI